MKISIVLAGIVVALLAAQAATAQHRPEGRRFGPPAAPRAAPKPAATQEASLKVPAAPGERRGAPMTSEERLQLRRDIDVHGREIYGARAPARR